MKAVTVVAGTRPEIIKMAPIIRALRKRNVPMIFVHCGQHYDYNMSQQFIEDLELPPPDYTFKIKAYSAGVQTARIMMNMDELLKKTAPSLVLVEGDTNSVLAAALASNKRGIPAGHVEAGLRSFDLRMPEEHNRRLTDHVSGYLFAPTALAEANLKKENVWGKIFVTGNTIIDAVLQHLPIAEKKSEILDKIHFKRFALATAHRAENVDDLKVLKNFIGAFAESPVPVVYPMHPRTKKRLRQNKMYAQLLKSGNVQVLPPVGYLDFLVLMRRCELVVTDSGGIQEEATAPSIRKPVLVIRLSTERPEAVEAGFAKVVGTEKQKILKGIEEVLVQRKELSATSPFGDGNAAEKIVEIIQKEFYI
ncbi:UDP-N-acetylglucosamine 2-epimerase (non-hydrolyzing) [Candidatus Bathyarchaeota archaeon A05DMB-2]|jgi:UDP-N-acetylglucosamine 2-epimerase (non-hydrolysing)|nr:UDP-N-acetylglucosamine 2-epimerase (non-hydrolyzing) [Candidatus Bathyarchaeota archaeon A05DMB-2]